MATKFTSSRKSPLYLSAFFVLFSLLNVSVFSEHGGRPQNALKIDVASPLLTSFLNLSSLVYIPVSFQHSLSPMFTLDIEATTQFSLSFSHFGLLMTAGGSFFPFKTAPEGLYVGTGGGAAYEVGTDHLSMFTLSIHSGYQFLITEWIIIDLKAKSAIAFSYSDVSGGYSLTLPQFPIWISCSIGFAF